MHQRKGRWAIKSDGYEGQLLADFIEQGGDLRGATDIINLYREQHGLEKAKKLKTRKIAQGSSDPYSPWARASFKWAKQLAIHFGTLNPYTTKDHPMPEPLATTKSEWIQAYNDDKQCDKICLAALKAQVEAERDPQEHDPFLPILLP
eukprot:6279692-Ditylum_brightwellii.AAC.1